MFELSEITDDTDPLFYLSYQHGRVFVVIISQTETVYIHGHPDKFVTVKEVAEANKVVRVFPDGSRKTIKDRDGPV